MVVYPSEDRMRLKRQRSEKAIQLAMQNRWQEAVEINRQILELFPSDVDAHNRLGKALLELAQYTDARDAYSQAAKLDPSNTIAAKNLARLATLADEEGGAVAVAQATRQVDPRLFIEESGKTAVTSLVDIAPFESIAALTAGDALQFEVNAGVVSVVTGGQVIGLLEPKIAKRVVRLTEMGNRYTAAITSIEESHVRIIIRETFRDPSMRSRPSFPTHAPEVRPYTKDSVFRADVDEDDEDLMDEGEHDLEGSDGNVADASTEDDELNEERER